MTSDPHREPPEQQRMRQWSGTWRQVLNLAVGIGTGAVRPVWRDPEVPRRFPSLSHELDALPSEGSP